jgi:hypothetical protein
MPGNISGFTNTVSTRHSHCHLNADCITGYADRLSHVSNAPTHFDPPLNNRHVQPRGAKSLSIIARHGLSCGPLIEFIIKDCKFAQAQEILGTDRMPGIIDHYNPLEQFVLIMEVMVYFTQYQDNEVFSLYSRILRILTSWENDPINKVRNIYNEGVIRGFFCRYAIDKIPNDNYLEFQKNMLLCLENINKPQINDIVITLVKNSYRIYELVKPTSTPLILKFYDQLTLATLRCDPDVRTEALNFLQRDTLHPRGEHAGTLLAEFRENLSRLNIRYLDNHSLSEFKQHLLKPASEKNFLTKPKNTDILVKYSQKFEKVYPKRHAFLLMPKYVVSAVYNKFD